jgi:hypothetical protein
MDLDWTRGSGDKVLVIAKAGSSPTDPTDGSTYTVDAEYAAGEAVGGGYVIYDGTGIGMTFTGLSPSITYYFAFYEYSSACSTTNYNLVQYTGSQATPAGPSSQASAYSASNVGCTSMDISWTRGNGDAVMVLASEVGDPSTNPTQGTSYAADAAFGSGDPLSGGFIVYSGIETSVTVTNLDPNTTYYYDIFEYYSPCNGYNNVEHEGNQSTLGTAPSTQASILVKSNVDACQLDLSWTRGNGDRVLIMARAGSSIAVDPTDGVSYTADAEYGAGEAVGAWYVIYDGTGTSMTLTGCPASTTMYFAFYEYSNACSTTNYNLAQYTGSQYMPAASGPGTQASAGSCSNEGCTSMDVSWTRGDGDKVLVVARTGAVTDPTQLTAYTADPDYSGSGSVIGATGKVVYNDVGTLVSVSGLSPNTLYGFDVYEYYDTPCTEYNLVQITPNSSTLGAAPTTNASSFVKSNIESCQMDLSWVRGDGDGVMVVVKTGGYPTDALNGTVYTANADYSSGDACGGGYVVYNGTSTSMTLTGLLRSTTYYFEIYEYSTTCGITMYKIAPLSGGTQATLGEPVTQASVVSVSNEDCTSMDVSWTRGSGDAVLVVAKEGSAPITDPTQGDSYTANASFSLGDALSGGFIVYNGTGTSVSVTNLVLATTYYYAIYEYYSPCNAYYLTQATTSSSTLGAAPASLTSISVGNASCSTIDITGIVGLSEKVLIIARPGGFATDPTNGTTYTASSVYGSGDLIGTGRVVYAGTMPSLPYTITNLSGVTAYSFDAYHYSDVCTTPAYNMTEDIATTSTIVSAPAVSAVTSITANGTYSISEVITITVTFTQNVIVTGTPLLLLETGTTDRNATYSSGTGTTTLTFLYTVQSGDVSADLNCQSTGALTLNGGAIDGVCLPALLTVGATMLSSTKAIVIDGNPPIVSTYNPLDDETDAIPSQSLTLTFNENIQIGTAGTFVIYNSGGSTFESFAYNSSSVTFSGTSVIINPTTDFTPGNSYYVEISATAVRDANGNYYAGIADNSTWNFTVHVPQNFYVNDNSTTGDVYCTAVGNSANNGTTVNTPKITLAAAYSIASAGDYIYVDAGTYNDVGINVTKAGIIIIGAGMELTIFDSNSNSGYFMQIVADNVVLSELRISDYGYGSGGDFQSLGIGDGSSKATYTGILVQNVQIDGNGGSSGDMAVKVFANTTSSLIGGGGTCNNASTTYSGAIRVSGTNINLTILDYSFVENSGDCFGGDAGGAIRITDGNSTQHVIIRNARFDKNEKCVSTYYGMDIFMTTGDLKVYDCVFTKSCLVLKYGYMLNIKLRYIIKDHIWSFVVQR